MSICDPREIHGPALSLCAGQALAGPAGSGQPARVPDIIASNEYESPALFWMYREIKRLDEVMQSVGLADQGTRRQICEEFFLGTEDGLTRPIAAVDAEQFTPKLVLIANDGRHLEATDSFDFHEYAHAIVHEYYEHPHPE